MPVSPGNKTLFARCLRALLSALLIAGGVWLLTGALLRLTGERDRYDEIAIVYYTTPWPVIAAGAVVLGISARWKRQGRSEVLCYILAAAAAIAWLWTSWYFAAPINTAPDLRVVLWNVRNGESDLDEFAARIRAFSPDIVALAEAGNHLSNIDFWRAAFPEYTVKRLPQQMLTMSRNNLHRGKSGALAPRSFFGVHTSEFGDRKITIVQTDIDARPLRSRREALDALTRQIREHKGQPLILLGDFNIPANRGISILSARC